MKHIFTSLLLLTCVTGRLTTVHAQTNCSSFTVSVNNNGPLTCTQTSVRLTVPSAGNNATYVFTGPSSATQTNGTSSRMATVSQPGEYTVLVTNAQGCTATATTLVGNNTAAPENITLNNNGPLTCAKTSVRLTVSSAGNNATYAFSGPEPFGQPTGTSSRTATTSQLGEYTVLVTNAQGCTATATTLVESNTAAPENVLDNNGPLTCTQTSVRLTVPSAGNNATYVFTGPSSATQTNGTSSRTATVNQPGNYTVLITNAQGCTATATTLVEINTDPPRNLSLSVSNVLTCAQPTAELNASSGGVGNPSLVITGPGNQSYSASTATVSKPGEYTLTATRNNNGCSATQTVTVESNTTAPENVTLTNNGPLTCAKTTVQLTAGSSTSGPLNYSFTGANPITQDGSSLATVTSAGSYTVTVSGTNGCTATATTEVGFSLDGPTIDLTNNGPLSFTNTSVTLSATAGQGYSYTFSNGAVYPGSGNTATVNTAGVYSVTVTRQDNGCSTIASTTVLGGNNPTVCRGGTAVINVAVEGAPMKYEWYKNSLTTPKLMETPQLFRGTATASLTLINAQSNTQGNFYLKVTYSSGTVRVYGPYRLTVDASCRAREVASLEIPLQVDLAPNPIQEDRIRAVVRGAEGRTLQLELVDLSGKPIRQQRWQQADSQQLIDWDMQAYSSGVYVLQAISEGNAGLPAQRQSVKVVKP
ncbi:T9SS type A sorting domain-containing protein [Spirosoma fluminis]